MKKVLLLCGLLALTGCSKVTELATNDTSEKPVSAVEKDTTKKTVICTGADDEQITLEAYGDKVQKLTDVLYVPGEELGIASDEEAAVIQDAINDALSNKYGSIEGVTTNGTMQEDGRIQITIQIDFLKADKQALVNAGLLKQGEKDSTVVSLKETKKAYSSSGYACQVQ